MSLLHSCAAMDQAVRRARRDDTSSELESCAASAWNLVRSYLGEFPTDATPEGDTRN
jgi:hypothetical protein